MTGGGVSGNDMPSLPWTARQDVSPVDDTFLESLLAGNGLQAGAGAELRPVADALAALGAHPAGDELTGLAAARAEFRRRVAEPVRGEAVTSLALGRAGVPAWRQGRLGRCRRGHGLWRCGCCCLRGRAAQLVAAVCASHDRGAGTRSTPWSAGRDGCGQVGGAPAEFPPPGVSGALRRTAGQARVPAPHRATVPCRTAPRATVRASRQAPDRPCGGPLAASSAQPPPLARADGADRP